MNQKPQTVDEYLSNTPNGQKEVLLHLQDLIRQAVPEAEEKMSYGIPCFYQNGYLIGYAAAKKHLSLFPGAESIAMLADKLKDYSLSKGTIRFTTENRLPDELVLEIVKLCAERNAVRSENEHA